jgi:hypothetical protein
MLAHAESTTRTKEIDRGALAKMVMNLLDHWDLPTEDQLELLGLANTNRSALGRYRQGEPIGVNKDQYARVGHLLGIHKNLRILFPRNKEQLYSWMKTKNRAFEKGKAFQKLRFFVFFLTWIETNHFHMHFLLFACPIFRNLHWFEPTNITITKNVTKSGQPTKPLFPLHLQV